MPFIPDLRTVGDITDPAVTNPVTDTTLQSRDRGIETTLGQTTDAAVVDPAITNATATAEARLRGILTSLGVPGASLSQLLYDILGLIGSTGTVFFLDNSSGAALDVAANGLTPALPTATLAYTLTRTTANRGDIILALPGHAENIAAATNIANQGVVVLGLSRGLLRPTFTVTNVLGQISVTGHSARISNLRFANATAIPTANIVVGATDCEIDHCWMQMGVNDQVGISLAGAATRPWIHDNVFDITADGPLEAILITAGQDRGVIEHNTFFGGSVANAWDNAAIWSAVANTNLVIKHNQFVYGRALGNLTTTTTDLQSNEFSFGARPTATTPIDLYVSTQTNAGPATKEYPTTIANALTLAADGDRILFYPGSYASAVLGIFAITRVTFQPVDYEPGTQVNNVQLNVGDGVWMQTNATGIIIRGLSFFSNANPTVVGEYLLSFDSQYGELRDCVFDCNGHANRNALQITNGRPDWLIAHNRFVEGAAGRTYISWGGGNSEFRDNFFDGSGAALTHLAQTATTNGTNIHHNTFLGNNTAAVLATWQAAPGINSVWQNYLMATGGVANVLGNDVDLDPMLIENYQDGSATGFGTIIDPS